VATVGRMRALRQLRSRAVAAAAVICVATCVTATAELVGRARAGATTATAATPAAPAEATLTGGSQEQNAADERAQLAREAAAGRLAAAATQARRDALTKALQRYANDGARFAVAILDNTTGTSFTFGSSRKFETASIMKVEILAAVLMQAQDQHRSLTANERALASRMIRYSDNDAATSLWWSVGGHAGLVRAIKRLGLTATTPGSDGWWGTTTTTVVDQIRVISQVTDAAGPLSRASVKLLLGLMTTVSSDQDWGISAAAEDGEQVALKNGWMTGGLDAGGWTVNSIGRITDADTDLTIAVLSQGNPGMSAGVGLVDGIATLARRTLHW
jgi:hypothetical protein